MRSVRQSATNRRYGNRDNFEDDDECEHHGSFCGLTTPEPSRAGPASVASLHHLDELRHPSGSDSGEVVRRRHV